MADRVRAGAWVEIHRVLLEPGQRAERVPEDTRGVPLEMLAKGWLCADAQPGDEVEIETAAGRRLRGTLRGANPPYEHGFGPPLPELLAVASEVRRFLRRREGGA